MNKQTSFSSANVFPAKLLINKSKCVSDFGFIHPIHLQVCPTNKCNLNCSFCSCAKREKNQELEFNELMKMMSTFCELGTRSITITGGGEPCMYEKLSDFIYGIFNMKLDMGLVTNGLLLNKIERFLLYLTWCRISVSDDRDLDKLFSVIRPLVTKNRIDWAFSYVLTSNFDINQFVKVVEFANTHSFTHVRLVSDILDLDNIIDIKDVKDFMKDKKIDDSLVIYQDRKAKQKGVKKCRISLLKPVIAPDGFVYPCCGVQYAMKESNCMFPEKMRMCHISDINKYFMQQKTFNGTVCDTCYYTDYNNILDVLVGHYEHINFV